MRMAYVLFVFVVFFKFPLIAQEFDWLNENELLEFYKKNNTICYDFRSDNTCSVISTNLYLGDNQFLGVSRTRITNKAELIHMTIEDIYNNNHCINHWNLLNSKTLSRLLGEKNKDIVYEYLRDTLSHKQICTKLRKLPNGDPLGNVYISYAFTGDDVLSSSTMKVIDDPDDFELRILGISGVEDVE